MCNEIFIEEKFVWYILMIGLLAFKLLFLHYLFNLREVWGISKLKAKLRHSGM